MAEHIKKTIVDLKDRIARLEEEVLGHKRTVNTLCQIAGMNALYSNVDVAPNGGKGSMIRPDQFYGRPLATVVREILELSDQAMPVNEIHARMLEGGYLFDAKNTDNAKRILRISLGKNSGTFHKLPNGTWGLLEWYPKVRSSSKTATPDKGQPQEDQATELSAKPDFGEPEDTDAERIAEAKSIKG